MGTAAPLTGAQTAATDSHLCWDNGQLCPTDVCPGKGLRLGGFQIKVICAEVKSAYEDSYNVL